MLVTLSEMTILDREVQLENAKLPIRVTLSGITILDREVQLEKAPSPMLVTLFGITMLDREVHSAYLLLVDDQYYTL